MITRKGIYYTVNDTLYGLNESTLKNTSIKLNLVANPKQLSEQIYNKLQSDAEIFENIQLSEIAEQTLIKLSLFEELHLEKTKEYKRFVTETALKLIDTTEVITETTNAYYPEPVVSAGARTLQKNSYEQQQQQPQQPSGNVTAKEAALGMGIAGAVGAMEPKMIERAAYKKMYNAALKKGMDKVAAKKFAEVEGKKLAERAFKQHWAKMGAGQMSKAMAGKTITKMVTRIFASVGIKCGSKAALAACTFGISLIIEAILIALSTGGVALILKSKKLVGFLYKYCIKQKWKDWEKSKKGGFFGKIGSFIKNIHLKIIKATYEATAFLLYGDTTTRIIKAAVKYGIADKEDMEKYKNDTNTSFVKNNAISQMSQIAKAKRQQNQQQNQQQRYLNANNNVAQYAA